MSSSATDPASRAAPPVPGAARLQALLDLLASMRFAISLLTVICIASVIGTVLQQNQPAVNYVNQFGPFWAQLFGALHLYSVYSAWWFLLILGFLVLSTSLCVARNTPKILIDLKTFKENIRESSLKAFGQHAEAGFSDGPEAVARRLGAGLVQGGWKVRLQQRETPLGAGWMVAAKTGAANKLGYIAAHSAIVLVCLGGLLDGDLIVRAQTWFNGKVPYTGAGLIADVPEQHRLSVRNPTFRGNLMVAEGTQSSTAILNQSEGVLLQELPFAVELKKFIVEHYSTGMPKLFASEIVIHDKVTGAQTPARVEVNHPVNYGGIEIYQSSFDDGGSQVTLQATPLSQLGGRFEVKGVVGGATPLTREQGGAPVSLEFTALRLINVENFSGNPGGSGSAVDVRKVDLRDSVESRLGAANKTQTKKELRNIGPSVTYKLRDEAGQAREFHNYMLPVDMGDGGVPVMLLGLRENPGDPFRYLRLPVDEQGGLDGFIRLRAALGQPALREQAVRRYVNLALDASRPELAEQLRASAGRALDLFAGATPATREGQRPSSGLQAVADFIEAQVPEAERPRAGEVLIRILNGVLFQLNQVAREQAGLKPLPSDEKAQAYMTQAVLSLSDAQAYPVPMVFMLKDFTQVQASVFQVARAPGKSIVYLGCALLILGVFAMLYIRERRVWVWVRPQGEGSWATLALSTNRKTLDGDREFDRLKDKLLGLAPTEPLPATPPRAP
ncbi:cytochrome c biogenesis protein ResB [Curvibacter sp. HBC28]|uniref:Cytochrome c biogenesis protein ResB n=1 Tax=Curvibacter microcysteis TaxID=3026419 RepID=A0ABT5MI49_9BURK|nr:cytochrome c biogenesis protein ResB [Curvibacter sp. HBC28]MDD0816267.1 cytochrome c biogenesis protein ResB [Curvibacter sp. HBC28]